MRSQRRKIRQLQQHVTMLQIAVADLRAQVHDLEHPDTSNKISGSAICGAFRGDDICLYKPEHPGAHSHGDSLGLRVGGEGIVVRGNSIRSDETEGH